MKTRLVMTLIAIHWGVCVAVALASGAYPITARAAAHGVAR